MWPSKTFEHIAASLLARYLRSVNMSEQTEKAYQKQHLFQNAKSRGESKFCELDMAEC